MLYDINHTFEYNISYGPFWDEKIPQIPITKKKTQFLGFELNSPFGVAACPLTANSKFILLLSKLGYDILTYKSMRSVEWKGNQFPHWQYVDINAQLNNSSHEALKAQFEPFGNAEVSMANSFGIQSPKPQLWQEDVELTLKKLSAGQLLILSLMCTPQTGEKLVDDAHRLAKLANETSAQVFEINLACPNTDGGQGLIYEDLEHSLKLCEAMKQELGDKHLLVKVGYYSDQNLLKEFMEKSKGFISGIATTNTYPRKIETVTGEDAFPGRPTAGVSGGSVRTLSQQQAKNAVRFKRELGLNDFVIIGIGGVTKSEHIDEYLKMGVSAVQSAVGVFADPLLAYTYKTNRG